MTEGAILLSFAAADGTEESVMASMSADERVSG